MEIENRDELKDKGRKFVNCMYSIIHPNNNAHIMWIILIDDQAIGNIINLI